MIEYKKYPGGLQFFEDAGMAAYWEGRILYRLKKAMKGDRVSESALVTRLGYVRATVPHEQLKQLPSNLRDALNKATRWLRSVGRRFHLQSANPAHWISTREGYQRDQEVEIIFQAGRHERPLGVSLGQMLAKQIRETIDPKKYRK